MLTRDTSFSNVELFIWRPYMSMINRSVFSTCLLVISTLMYAQSSDAQKPLSYGPHSVFSHNDYVQPVPFYTAYLSQAGFVEADIFLEKRKLLVAHTKEEIVEDRTLEEMYLKPLRAMIRRNKGRVYADSLRQLTLMIDLKSEGESTLAALVTLLGNYKDLTATPSLQLVISGNMPAPATWNKYPAFIKFDGRPGVSYTPEQLVRVALVSDSFSRYSSWNGRGELDEASKARIVSVRDESHAQNRALRLWGSPDTNNAWATFMRLNVDIINTDHPQDAVKYVSRYHLDNFKATARQATYRPARKFPLTASPKNVILLISDGTGLAQIYSGYTANHGGLNMFNMGTVGLSITNASNAYITDSAAGATALSTGKKTNNRYIGVDSVGTKLPTIAEQLKAKGYHVAIASSGDITDATPASFYAHQIDRKMSEPIAHDFLSSNIDILIGANRKSFIDRTDNLNLFTELQRKGYTVADRLASLDTIRSNRFVVVDDAATLTKANGRGDFLVSSFRKAATMCSRSNKPFFMMFEGAQVDWGGHDNTMPYLVTEMLDFDAMVGEAVKFADADGETLVVVTADHETGGLSLLGGDFNAGSVRGNFSTGGHTAIPVPVFAFGPGAHEFTGVYNNTEIYHKLLRLLKVTAK